MSRKYDIDDLINDYVNDSAKIEEPVEIHEYFVHESNDGFEYLHKLLDDKKPDYNLQQKINEAIRFLTDCGYIISERPIENEENENDHSI